MKKRNENLGKLGVRHFINGGLGGLTSGLIVQPLQVIKTAYQVKPYSHCTNTSMPRPTKNSSILAIAKFIYHQEGVRGLYRGLIPGCIKSSLSAGTYFYLLSITRRISERISNKSLADLVAAMLARTAQTFITNPILIVKTRFEVVGFNEYSGLVDAFVTIYRKEGLMSFFTNGITYALLRDVPFSAIQFPVYEAIKTRLMKLFTNEANKNGYMKTPVYAASSMCATFISCVLTNPLDVIRTRVVFQYYNKNSQQHYNGIKDAVVKLFKYDGWKGFFFGLESRFLKKVTGAMIAWTIYECLLDKQKKARST